MSHSTKFRHPQGSSHHTKKSTWWRHQMETFSASQAHCAGNSSVTDEFPSQRPVTQSFDVFFDPHMNKWLSKQSKRRQFETPSHSLIRRHCQHSWWRHQMEIFSALLAICAGNSPAPGEFPAQRPVTRVFNVFFDLPQPWGWGFEMLSRPLWRHHNVIDYRNRCINSVRLTCKISNIEYANIGHNAWKPCHSRKSP